jgi:phosphoglycolate phosphatase-like HAD superfamily hydrolase
MEVNKIPTKTIIWDMDGVIADTGSVKIGAFKKTFNANGMKPVHDDDQLLKSSRPSHVFQEYSDRCGVELSKIFHDFYQEDIKTVKSFFTNQEWKELSSNFVSIFCTAQPLEKEESTLLAIFGESSSSIFDEVITEENLQGESKSSDFGVQVISKVLSLYSSNTNEVYFVGDPPDDLLCAKRIGAKSIAVAWGYYSHHDIELHEPDKIAHTCEQLLYCIMVEA